MADRAGNFDASSLERHDLGSGIHYEAAVEARGMRDRDSENTFASGGYREPWLVACPCTDHPKAAEPSWERPWWFVGRQTAAHRGNASYGQVVVLPDRTVA